MLKRIIVRSILLMSLVACKSKAKTAREYNDRLVNVEAKLEPLIIKTENAVKKFLESAQYDSVAVAGEKMERAFQENIDSISKEPAPKVNEAENFKAAYLSYFRFFKGTYTNYKKLGQAANDEERDAIIEELRQILNKKEKVIYDLQSAQRKYAAANGLAVK